MPKTRISKKSLAAFPDNIAIAIKDFKTRYGVASFSYEEKNQGDSFYFAEGATVKIFYGNQEASIKMVSADTVGSNDCYAIGTTIKPKAGTTILEFKLFLGKYFLNIYNYDLRVSAA